jgi:hypothetical protein
MHFHVSRFGEELNAEAISCIKTLMWLQDHDDFDIKVSEAEVHGTIEILVRW